MKTVGLPLIAFLAVLAFPCPSAIAKEHHCLLVHSSHATEACFAPSRVAAAGRTMSFPPVNPTAVVLAVTGLSPIQIIVDTEMAYSYRHVRAGTTSIHYLYGAVPAIHGYIRSIPTPYGSTTASTPKFVLVQEIVGQYVPTAPREYRITCPPGLAGTAVLMDGVGGCGLWYFTQYLPGRHLTVTVAANVTRAQVYRVGWLIARSARPGK